MKLSYAKQKESISIIFISSHYNQYPFLNSDWTEHRHRCFTGGSALCVQASFQGIALPDNFPADKLEHFKAVATWSLPCFAFSYGVVLSGEEVKVVSISAVVWLRGLKREVLREALLSFRETCLFCWKRAWLEKSLNTKLAYRTVPKRTYVLGSAIW